MWKNELTKVYIVPVAIGTLGMVSKNISRGNWVRWTRKTSESRFVENS